MRGIIRAIRNYVEKADMLLLLLCTAASVFGIVMIASATAYLGTRRYVLVQIAALIMGLGLNVLFSLIDIDIIAERRDFLLIFNLAFISMLFIWGVDDGTGNKSWLYLRLIRLSIQPAEICKITFVIIMARMMQNAGDRLSSPLNVGKITLHLLVTVGLIIAASSDAGNALVFVFLFIIIAYAGGVRLGWFALGGGALAIAAPTIWTRFMRDDQKERILMIFDPNLDPTGVGVRYQTKRSLMYLQSSGLLGDGLFRGEHTQVGYMPMQHNDFIFSVVGEELGLIGCIIVLLLLTAIVVRIIYVGVRSQNYMSRLICIGIASILLFQIIIDVGMCIGLLPVIGLTLPFISYGGSSLLTLMAAMGIVSGIKMRPASGSGIKYVYKSE